MDELAYGISGEEQEREIPILKARIIEILKGGSHNALSRSEIEELLKKGAICPLWQTEHRVPLIGVRFRSSSPRARSYFISIALTELIENGVIRQAIGAYIFIGDR